MKVNYNNASLAMSAGLARQFPRDPRPQIVFSGRSNVGKSSLINTLLNRKSLARVSASPGKTVTINFYDVDSKLYLVDLPGYGYAKRNFREKKVWSALTDDFFVHNACIDYVKLVVQLIDVRVGPTEDDAMMISFLLQQKMPFMLVATKADKLSPTALAAQLKELEMHLPCSLQAPILPFSAVSGAGRQELLNAIQSSLS